jgi:hypothetical protein
MPHYTAEQKRVALEMVSGGTLTEELHTEATIHLGAGSIDESKWQCRRKAC